MKTAQHISEIIAEWILEISKNGQIERPKKKAKNSKKNLQSFKVPDDWLPVF